MIRVAALSLTFAIGTASLLSAAQALEKHASIYFTARDGKSRLISNLKREEVRVFEDGEERTVRAVARATGPLDAGILLDTSTGVIPMLELEAEAAAAFFKTVIRSGDLGFAVSYNNRIDVLQAPAEDVRLLVRGTSRVPGYGRYVIAPLPKAIRTQTFPLPIPLPLPTPLPNSPPEAWPQPPVPLPVPANRKDTKPHRARLFDAVTTSVGRFMTRPSAGRNLLVILALSDDAASLASLDDALRTLKQNHVTAYVIAVEDERPPVSSIVSGLLRRVDAIRRDDRDMAHTYSGAQATRIARIAEETGGRVIHIKGFKNQKLNEAFQNIAEEIGQQQVVTFSGKDRSPSTPIKLDIRATRKDTRISAPAAHYTKQ